MRDVTGTADGSRHRLGSERPDTARSEAVCAPELPTGRRETTDLVLVGTSHRIAPVDVRARVAALIADARWHAGAGIAELMTLATCHRVEIYAVAADAPAAAHAIRATLAATADETRLYSMAGLDALRHLCGVACGLDSMVIGEAEVAGQLRRAAVAARSDGQMGPALERLVAAALRSSGRARSETRIAVGALSAAAAGAALVERALGSLRGQSVVVVGAGEAGRQALACLARRRPGRLAVVSRSRHHADQAAARYAAASFGLAELPRAIADSDALIAATRAEGLLVGPAALGERRGRPLFVLDLSVPPVIDRCIQQVPGVTLRSVDDLGDIVRESTARRLAEVPRVQSIIEQEAARAYASFARRMQRATA